MKKVLKENSSLLFAIGGGVGVVATAYLSAQAGYRAAHKLSNQDPWESNREKARRVWKLYVPAGISGAATIVCIAGVKRIDGKKTLAAQTALAVSQRAYESYRAEIIDEFGDRKDKSVLAKVAEKRVEEKPPPAIVAGSGTVLCCETFSGRYFNGDMQSLEKAVNELNARLLRQDYATLDDFYYLIGLEYTSVSGQTGWESSKLLELEFSSILHEGTPCLAFDYNYVKSF